MIAFFRKLFIQKCSECKHDLICESDGLCCVKSCPEGHYSEETYCFFGVRLVYKR